LSTRHWNQALPGPCNSTQSWQSEWRKQPRHAGILGCAGMQLGMPCTVDQNRLVWAAAVLTACYCHSQPQKPLLPSVLDYFADNNPVLPYHMYVPCMSCCQHGPDVHKYSSQQGLFHPSTPSMWFSTKRVSDVALKCQSGAGGAGRLPSEGSSTGSQCGSIGQ